MSLKVEHQYTREDGAEARIVAWVGIGRGLHQSIGVDVFRRESPEHHWSLCSDMPAPGWREMSVDDYLHKGRSEKLRTVSHGEILKASMELKKLIVQ